MKKFVFLIFLIGSIFLNAKVAKISSPSCKTTEDVKEFVKIYSDTHNAFTAILAKPNCRIMKKGAAIKSVLETSWAYVKILWIDQNGDTAIGWVVREAVY